MQRDRSPTPGNDVGDRAGLGTQGLEGQATSALCVWALGATEGFLVRALRPELGLSEVLSED